MNTENKGTGVLILTAIFLLVWGLFIKPQLPEFMNSVDSVMYVLIIFLVDFAILLIPFGLATKNAKMTINFFLFLLVFENLTVEKSVITDIWLRVTGNDLFFIPEVIIPIIILVIMFGMNKQKDFIKTFRGG